MEKTDFLRTFNNVVDAPPQYYGRTHDTHIAIALSAAGGIHVGTAPVDANDGRIKTKHVAPRDITYGRDRRVVPGVGFHKQEDLTLRNDGVPIHLGGAAITRTKLAK